MKLSKGFLILTGFNGGDAIDVYDAVVRSGVPYVSGQYVGDSNYIEIDDNVYHLIMKWSNNGGYSDLPLEDFLRGVFVEQV